MPVTRQILPFALILVATLGGCGLFVPDKDLLTPDARDETGASREGRYENTIVAHILCEAANGIWEANQYLNVRKWLPLWGTSATLTITAQDQSGLNPGVSLIDPLQNWLKVFPVGGNVTSPQSFNLGIGATGSANGTRKETIQFTYANKDLLDYVNGHIKADGTLPSCAGFQDGVMIESNLKIGQFIYDKAVIASLGNDTTKDRSWPPFNTFTEEITFVASYGGNITPTWKFARAAVNSSSTLLNATRTNTNDLIITVGPMQTEASISSPATLGTAGTAQHNASVVGSATATAIQSQTH